MTRLRALLHLALVIAAAFAFVAGGRAGAAQGSEVAQESDRQILVMLKMAPPHFRPNSGYSGSYGDTQSSAARQRIARGIARRNGLKLIEGWPMPLLAVDCYVMVVPPGRSVQDIIESVSRESAVAWSQPMYSYKIGAASAGPPNDPLFPVQPTAAAWRLAELQQVATGRGVNVAIIDSKVDALHPDLAGRIVTDMNFADTPATTAETHGTGVAGIIGAAAGNGKGIAGVAPNARLMALRACWEMRSGAEAGFTFCRSLALARALQYAIENGADVVNLSLSGPRDPLLAELVELAVSRNIAVVAAFDQNLPQGGFPASAQGVIAVADESMQSLPDGVYGAPGRDLPTTQPGGGWSLVNGTSYAVAQISGLVALVGERDKRYSAIKLVRAPNGKVRACATLLGTLPECDCSCKLGKRFEVGGTR